MIWRTNILATHEERQSTSLGEWPGDDFLGVALPSKYALRKRLYVRYGEKTVYVECHDVGPWCVDDDDYVLHGERPRAEVYKGRYCPLKKGSLALATVPNEKGEMVGVAICNGAAIDLFPGTSKALGIEEGDNVFVDWAFIV